jgi:hypothetical protein
MIFLLVPSLEQGGTERQATLLALALRARNLPVHMIVFRGGVFARDIEAAGIPLTIIGDGRWISYFIALAKLLRAEKTGRAVLVSAARQCRVGHRSGDRPAMPPDLGHSFRGYAACRLQFQDARRLPVGTHAVVSSALHYRKFKVRRRMLYPERISAERHPCD